MKQSSSLPAVRRHQGAHSRPRLARHALAASIAAAFGTAVAPAWAQLPPAPLPTGEQVVSGNAGITRDGNQMTVVNSPNAVINWDRFSIDAGYGVHFQQESTTSKVLNQVVGNDPSNIFGNLSSNGAVWLINPNGMLFGSSARVNVAGLVASTLPLSTSDFLAGQYRFGGGGTAAIRTEPGSEINTTLGGHVVLIGASIENGGSIDTSAGHIALAAVSSVELVDSGVPNLTVRISGPANTATNLGSLLSSSGGTIDVLGGIVNQEGIIRAENMGVSQPGRVSLQAQGNVVLGSASETRADGGYGESGGAVLVASETGSVTIRGKVSAASGDGDSESIGNGGRLAVSGKSVVLAPGAELSVSGLGFGGWLTVDATDGETEARGRLTSVGGTDFGGRIDLGGTAVTVGSEADIDVSGASFGGEMNIASRGGTTLVQGNLSAIGNGTFGGSIALSGKNVGVQGQTRIDASGRTFGGAVTIDRDETTPADATSSIYLGPDAVIRVNGQQEFGGAIRIGRNSDATRVYGTLEARSDADGGEDSFGGLVETSGQFVDVQAKAIDVRGAAFSGTWRVHAGNITVAGASTAPATDTPNFDVPATLDAGNVSAGLVSQALTDGAAVFLRAGFEREAGPPPATQPGNIVVASNILADDALPGPSLDLEAHNNISVDAGVRIESNLTPLPITLLKDVDVNGGGSVQLGAGSRIATAGGHFRIAGSTEQSESFAPVPRVAIGGEIDAGTGRIDIRSTSLELDNARLSSSAPESDAIYINARDFSSTGSELSAGNGGWRLWLDSGAAFSAESLADLDPGFVRVDAFQDTGPIGGPVNTNGGVLLADPLAVRARVNADREYDGTTNARFSEVLSSDAPHGFGYVTSGDGAFFFDGQFQNRNVGPDKPVSYDGEGDPFRLVTSTGVPVYGATTSYAAEITPRTLVLSDLRADNKVYDATRTATVNAGLANLVAGDDVALGGLAGLFDTKNAGTGKTVVVTGAPLQGADAFNYRLPEATTTADITPRALAAQNIVGADKVYDGTRFAAIAGVSFSGVLAGDDVTAGAGAALFDDKNVGTNKPITFTGSLGGADAPNYVFTGPLSATGSITPRTLALANLTADNKIYDATRTATVNAGLANVVAGDDVALGGLAGLFDTKNAGTGKTVAVTVSPLLGADAPNYTLPGATTTADIAPRPITVEGIVGADKVYDGTRRAFISPSSVFAGRLGDDDLKFGTSEILFDDKNVGTNKLITFTSSIMTGPDAPNYVFVGPLAVRGAITPRALEIGMAGPVAKEYDAGAGAGLRAEQYVLNGAVANDVLTVRGPTQGVYDSPNVGQQKRVTVDGSFDVAGADAPNYRIGTVNLGSTTSNAVTATVSANVGTITPATLLYQATPAVRAPGQPLSGFEGSVTGLRGADTLATATSGNLLWTGAATPQSPPGSYAIEGSGLLAANYVFAQAPGNATALLLQAPVPAAPVEIARESSTSAFNTALHSAVAAIDPPGIAGGVFDISSPAAGRSFAPVRIGSMNQNELAAMLDERRNFKRRLFADAIYKLEIDPSLANVQPCATVVESKTGACRIIRAQLDLVQGSQARAAAANIRKTAKNANLPQIERKIALLIGINEYQDRTIPRLENALPDVDALGALFADKLGYEVRVLRNPGKAEIIRSLNALSLDIGSSDSVVVYYAGHGYSLEQNGAGYWLPSDAMANDPRQWISNSDIAQLLAGVRSQQMALISDSCYSGAFARDGMDAVGVNVSADDVLTKRSVVVLSSGGDEPVADEGKGNHSIFAWNLMQVVGSVSNWKPGSTVFTDVQAGVKKEFPQTPKYGSVTAAGHQRGGDYLFELRGQ